MPWKLRINHYSQIGFNVLPSALPSISILPVLPTIRMRNQNNMFHPFKHVRVTTFRDTKLLIIETQRFTFKWYIESVLIISIKNTNMSAHLTLGSSYRVSSLEECEEICWVTLRHVKFNYMGARIPFPVWKVGVCNHFTSFRVSDLHGG